MVHVPQLKYTHESATSHQDHASGAAAQHNGSKFHTNFQSNGDKPWTPRLYGAHASFRDMNHPSDSKRGAAAHPTSYESAQQEENFFHESDKCQIYQTIHQDELCYQNLQMGGAYFSNRPSNKSTKRGRRMYRCHIQAQIPNPISRWSAAHTASDASLRTAPRCRRKAMP